MELALDVEIDVVLTQEIRFLKWIMLEVLAKQTELLSLIAFENDEIFSYIQGHGVTDF